MMHNPPMKFPAALYAKSKKLTSMFDAINRYCLVQPNSHLIVCAAMQPSLAAAPVCIKAIYRVPYPSLLIFICMKCEQLK